MKVKVVQFYTPNGRQEAHEVEVPDDCAEGYAALKSKGCRLTAEVLMTGHVSQCVEHEEGDFLIEVCANGPQVITNLANMIREFTPRDFDRWLQGVTA